MVSTASVFVAGSVPVIDPSTGGGILSLLWLIIALPAAGAAVILLLGNKVTKAFAHYLGVATVLGSFGLSVAAFIALWGRAASDRSVGQHLWTWFTAGSFQVDFGILLDPLSAVFLLLITGVGGLIHIYSVGYMAHDERRPRFFAFLNLFIAAMLILVMADNYLGVFLGWEGVGLASYLLIGFWQHKDSAAVAAKKAFVVNRVGDIGMALGTMLLFATFGTTAFGAVSMQAGTASQTTLNVLGLLFLLAAAGKSAQVPLQSWLLDAMEGPTPVSALIHAATMVTAGVYLVTRSNFIYEHSEVARTAVITVGAVTLIWGALIGTSKDDIKKVLAGSTMSQIGYMMLGAGLGVVGYAFAIFHLLMHGAFKANMFLGAGSVMHSMDDDVDMRHYGGLARAMPVTFGTFAMGFLAIIGFPGFSGFFSKDKIIEAAFGVNIWAGIAAVLGAGITAFYMSRLMLMTFYTQKRWGEKVHPHESPAVMTVPLVILALLSVFGGALIYKNWIVDWLAPVVGTAGSENLPFPAIVLSAIILITVAAGIALAWFTVGTKQIPREAPQDVSLFTRAARADLYSDAINEELFMRPGQKLVAGMDVFDNQVVDGLVEGAATGTMVISEGARKAQNGYVRTYALTVLLGAVLALGSMLVVMLG